MKNLLPKERRLQGEAIVVKMLKEWLSSSLLCLHLSTFLVLSSIAYTAQIFALEWLKTRRRWLQMSESAAHQTKKEIIRFNFEMIK